MTWYNIIHGRKFAAVVTGVIKMISRRFSSSGRSVGGKELEYFERDKSDLKVIS